MPIGSELEVILPGFPTGVVKGDDLPGLGVDRSDVTAFMLVAECARESQVGAFSCAAVLDRDDVIDLVRHEHYVARYEAVFTDCLCALDDFST